MAGDAHHHAPNPVHEVQDHEGFWPVFESLFGEPRGWHLPSFEIFGYTFHLTKFMILELIAAGLIIAIYVPLARRARNGDLPTGRFWNLFEGMLTFIRDEVARPNLDSHADHGAEEHGHGEHGHGEHGHGGHAHGGHGHGGHGHAEAGHAHEEHEADKYVPFLWTLFLFVLFCNLLGMIPTMGSPTASIWVTGGLAVISFVMMHGVAVAKLGGINYLASMWPKMGAGMIPISLLIFVIELFGTVIKSFVLAVRLFANMFAGHMVLANILFFIYVVGNAFGLGMLWGGVTVASVIGVVALSLLELFVGFLQAYIFTFLTALFMGMSLHHGDH